jgi:serine/threonine protein kinase
LKGVKLYRERYTLDDKISVGGFSTVYKARERGRKQPVAIKLGIVHDDPGYAESVRKEARIISSLEHRNIVDLFPVPREGKPAVDFARAVELEGSPPFFVMEYLSGGSLEEFLELAGTLSIVEATAIALEVARALDYIHRHGFVHNDLKLENVIFRSPVKAGQPFDVALIDFGIATQVNLQTKAATFYIMSPEQLSQVKMETAPELNANLDLRKVDVWGLGVILYRMLGGQLPFSGRTERTLTTRIMSSRPISLLKLSDDIPSEVDKMIIDGCLAKNPAHRVSVLELGRWLSEWGDGATAKVGVEELKVSRGTGFLRRLFG